MFYVLCVFRFNLVARIGSRLVFGFAFEMWTYVEMCGFACRRVIECRESKIWIFVFLCEESFNRDA